MDIYGYISNLNKALLSGQTTEHSLRGFLRDFLQSFDNSLTVINEPKRQQCGAPDYLIAKGNVPIGYVEAKDIDIDLDTIKDNDNNAQLERYKQGLENFIFTNFLDFYFFRNGKKTAAVRIGKLQNKQILPLPENFDQLLNLIKDFLTYRGETLKTAEDLAKIMAQKAVILRDVLEKILEETDNNSLQQQMEAFTQTLLHNITKQEFADVYAQTITYGLFVARLNSPSFDTFSRAEARDLVSRTNPFLRNLFDYISGAQLEERAVWIVEDLVEVFRACDIKGIMARFTKGQSDPFLYFYETFLTAYDKVTKKKRGVYYTPQPVVNFMVKTVDDILQKEFGLNYGLADTSKIKYEITDQLNGKKYKKDVFKVQLLDPATGTGTFLAETIKAIYAKFQNQQGLWPQYVKDALIPRLHGFELMMTPYVMCHLKLEMVLRETGYDLSHAHNQRFNVYLTNALENQNIINQPLFAAWLAEEARSAYEIKNDTPIMVVLGNPPYSGESSNGPLFQQELTIYKQEPHGGKLQERNSKWINDDYVKFIRLAQMFIDKNKEGVLAYITNNAFTDNPTFRGMRYNLLQSFDKIYILNLHGSARKKEKAPNGEKDENVFNIMTGVSINLFVKTTHKKDSLAQVFYADLYGTRKEKFHFLEKNTMSSIPWKKLNLDTEFYFFTNKDFSAQSQYNNGFKINEIFPLSSVGIVTARDGLCIQNTKEAMQDTITTFASLDSETARLQFQLGKDVRDWQVQWAQKDLLDTKLDTDNILSISYRPFDTKFTYYTGNSKGFHCMPRGKVMRHFVNRENIALNVSKLVKSFPDWHHIFISKHITESSLVSNKTSEIAYVFPLYIYADSQDFDLTREPNVNMKMVNTFALKTGLTFTKEKEDNEATFSPIDILDYIYGILHSNKYRKKYAEFLKIDFPRVPYPQDKMYFREIAQLGAELRKFHLLEGNISLITSYPVAGDNNIEEISYQNDRVYINKNQFFDKVPTTVWEFFIGGYQPAQKWLKDRKGLCLNFQEIMHYQKILSVLKYTEDISQKIDSIIKI